MQKLQELIRYNGGVATRAEAAQGLLTAGVPFAWVIRYLSDAVAMTPREAARVSPRHVKFARECERDNSVRSAQPGKPPHEMTHDEFARTLTGRIVREPSQTLPEWARARGREADTDFAELVGGMMTQAKYARGQAKPLIEKLARYNALNDEYGADVAAGRVPVTEKVVPLNPADSEADRAYIRAAHKRAVHKALGAGLTVPAEVLKDYPGLANTAPPPAVETHVK